MLGAGLVRKPPTLNESINVETTEKMGEKYYVLFGMLPAGKSKDSTPLSGVINVYTSNSYKIGAIILGAFVLLGLSMIGSSIVGALILILIGVAIFGSGIKTTFSYERSGIAKSIDVPFFEANHVREFEEKVLARIQGFQDDRNVRMQTQKSMAQSRENAQAIVDAVKGQAGRAKSTEPASSWLNGLLPKLW